MERYYFFLYLLYGLAFIAMGIYAGGRKEKEVSHIPLVKSLKYLGAFGVTHGLSEWVTMVVITQLYFEDYVSLFYLKQVLKAVSFIFLLYFGISLLFQGTKHWLWSRGFPVLLFVIWGVGLLTLIAQNGPHYHLFFPQYSSILLRYCMGLPGGILSAWALYRQAATMDKKRLYDVQMKYKRLAAIFLIYGLVDGLIVREMDFFPANFLNDSLFLEWFGFPVQILKILIGVGISYLLVQVINTFGWEQKEKMRQLEQQKIAYEERKKLGLEVHDSIIQNMYAATLKMKYLLKNKTIDDAGTALVLEETIEELGDAITKTREFISETTIEQVELKDLKSRMKTWVEAFDSTCEINIEVSLEDNDCLSEGKLSTQDTTHIYYIVQEAINNSIKHSKGTFVKVIMEAKSDALHVKVIDNGKGVCLSEVNTVMHFGIKAMCQRAEQINGHLTIRNRKPGTEVKVVVPWR